MRSPFTKNQELQREIMIREHLLGRGVHDPAVLAAMPEIPREASADAGLQAGQGPERPET
jgi:protein-L-isoaspartate(D-aspartate) O-methyltransferase